MAQDKAHQRVVQDLAQEVPLSEANTPTGSNNAPVNPREQQLDDLFKLMNGFVEAGLVRRNEDGSYSRPLDQASDRARRMQEGSGCACRQCSQHNQRHWVCVMCGVRYEWVQRRPHPNSPVVLGEAGQAGKTLGCCTDACMRELLIARQNRTEIITGAGVLPYSGDPGRPANDDGYDVNLGIAA